MEVKETGDPKENKRKKKSRRENIIAVSFGLFLAFLLLLLIEFVCMRVLEKRENITAPFLFNFSRSQPSLKAFQHKWGKELSISYLDPHLGYTHDPGGYKIFGDRPGFAVYSSVPDPSKKTIRIFALAGSTTDPLTAYLLGDPDAVRDNPYNWPHSLFEILKGKGINIEVYNGGVAGYTSNQEMLKIIRDVLPLKPDIVLCMDGVNEIGFAHSTPDHPMVHKYQDRLFTQLTARKIPFFLPNTILMFRSLGARKAKRISGSSMGPGIETTPLKQWVKNVRISHSVAREFGVPLIVFLQPILGFGQYDASAQELERLGKRGKKYRRRVDDFYQDAGPKCEEIDYCVDLTDVYKDAQDVYLDPRHQNKKGVDILAKAVYEELLRRGLL
ncbi:MAG: hypothetical protein GY940_11800 [bacterium]|nr:hypothetical protein [bacterium]